jgi:hypothetical protein
MFACASRLKGSHFLSAWLGLAGLYLAQERWSELAEAASKRGLQPRWRLEAAVLRIRRDLAAKEFSQARSSSTMASPGRRKPSGGASS